MCSCALPSEYRQRHVRQGHGIVSSSVSMSFSGNSAASSVQTPKDRFSRTEYHDTIAEGGEFPPESGRYVMYVCFGCPVAHRTLITRAIKGLEEAIDIIAVNPVWGVVDEKTKQTSWVFSKGTTIGGVRVEDPLFGARSLKDIYELDNPNFRGTYTVPVLFDKKTKRIVNNQSGEIMRILDSKFNQFAKHPTNTILPASVPLKEIDAAAAEMLVGFNDGVYTAGLAKTQADYDRGSALVFDYLDKLEARLATRRFYFGDVFSEADIRLFVTASRFDPVYHHHFKCMRHSLREGKYPNIFGWMCDVYANVLGQVRGGLETYNELHAKLHYFCSAPDINQYGILPDTGYNPLNKLEDARREAKVRTDYLLRTANKQASPQANTKAADIKLQGGLSDQKTASPAGHIARGETPFWTALA